MPRASRRHFLQTTAAAGASLLLAGTHASGNFVGANDRLRIAVAGLNSRGQAHISGWLGQKNVEIAYVIDPDENAVARSIKRIDIVHKSDNEIQCFPKLV